MNGGIGFGDLKNFAGIRELTTLMRDPNGIADLLLEAHPDTGDSPAEIFADIVNTTRADNRRMAEALDIEIDAELMTPDRAAHLLAGTVGGEGIDLVVMFNEFADQRAAILAALLEDEQFETFQEQKHAIMHTHSETEE